MLSENSATVGLQQVITRRRVGGGAVVATALVTLLPQHPLTLRMIYGGGNALYYYSFEPHTSIGGQAHFTRFCGILGWAVRPTRAGIVYESAVGGASADAEDRRCAVDWYHAN